MTQIKLTKMELRHQQYKLKQLEKYLPTLQLKKAMLQTEVNQAMSEIEMQQKEQKERLERSEAFQALLTDREADAIFLASEVLEVQKRYENIAGAEIPLFIALLNLKHL